LGGTSKVDAKRIRDYLYNTVSKGTLGFIPRGATNIRVYKLSRLGHSINDVRALSVAYRYEGKNLTLKLVLKVYRGKPSKKRCQERYRILRALENANFPVPHAYILETDEKFLGAPFIIMEKVEGKNLCEYVKHLSKEETLDIIKRFAETLAHLHDLKWEEMGLDFLTPPKDEYDYAKKQVREIKTLWKKWWREYFSLKDINWAINSLEINARKCPCDRYSILHVDMNYQNFLVTKERGIVVLDWEWPEIGDPLKDVGYAYHNIRQMFGVKNIDKKGAKIGVYFLRQYIKSSRRKIDRFSLRFYIFSAGLRKTLYLRYFTGRITHPFEITRIFGAKYLPLLPFVWWHFRSRYKHLEHFLRREAMDYERDMFGTPGGKILSSMEIKDVLRFLNAKPSQLILDVGTGPGRVAREIVSKAKANVIGIDVGVPAFQSAIRKGDRSAYEFVIADGQHMPFRHESFDGIVCIRTLKYFPDYILGISEMVRVLKPGKRVVVDLSNMLGYEIIHRRITHALGVRGSRVFNFYKTRNLLRHQKLSIVDSLPLQIIPHKIWNLSTNPTILQLLIVGESVLGKITPSIFSRSILLKCIKVK